MQLSKKQTEELYDILGEALESSQPMSTVTIEGDAIINVVVAYENTTRVIDDE